MEPNETQAVENDNEDEGVELEMLKQIFDSLDRLEEKVDELIEKDKGVHQMIEKED
jgi:hypothetical protein